MRTAELRERLHLTREDLWWYGRLLESHLLQTTRSPYRGKSIIWNDRDANWLIRLHETNGGKHTLTGLIRRYYSYYVLPYTLTQCLRSCRKPGRVLDDQWRDQVHKTAIRLRTYQIMLNTLLKDAMKAGYEPLDSWTDTSCYEKMERETIITDTREREPGA